MNPKYFDLICKVRKQERMRRFWQTALDILIILAFGFAAGTLDAWK